MINTLLAKVEHGTSTFNRMIGDYAVFFKNKQGMFEGIKKTFKPRDGYAEDARYMGTTKVATTVEERLILGSGSSTLPPSASFRHK